MSALSLERLCKTFRDTKPPVTAIRDVSLTIADAQRVAIVGPSGCGKTTLLRLIAGLESSDGGRVRLAQRDLAGVPPERRNVGMVFANDALFEHLSAFENIAYPLRIRRARELERRVRSEAAAAHADDLLERRPGQLSNGQRQRVALARAMATDPDLLLLDEPFSRLDAPLRTELRVEFARVLAEKKLTTIFVTHDQREAIAFGERLAVMRDGAFEQIGSARELYDRPKNAFVARFIGSPAMSFVPARILPAYAHGASVGGASLGVRPEAVHFAADGDVRGVVRAVTDYGSDAYAYVDGTFGSLVVRLCDGERRPRIGGPVGLRLDRARTHVFSSEGEHLGFCADV